MSNLITLFGESQVAYTRLEGEQEHAMGDNAYLKALYERRHTASPMKYRCVQTEDWKPERSRCHPNVDYWVSLHPDLNPVRGWMISSEDGDGRCLFVAHSVVGDAGELYDITLSGQEECNLNPFLRHLGTEEEFKVIRERHPQIVYPEPTPDDMMNAGISDDGDSVE